MGSWPAVWWVENSLIKALEIKHPPLFWLSYYISYPSQGSFTLAYFEAGLKILLLVLYHMSSSIGVTVEQDCSDPEQSLSWRIAPAN